MELSDETQRQLDAVRGGLAEANSPFDPTIIELADDSGPPTLTRTPLTCLVSSDQSSLENGASYR